MRCWTAGLVLVAACAVDDATMHVGGVTTDSGSEGTTASAGIATSGGTFTTDAADATGSSGHTDSTGTAGDGLGTGASLTSSSTSGDERGGSSDTETGGVANAPEPVFERVTEVSGLDMPHVCPPEPQFPPGIGWRDMNGDGHIDLVLTSFEGPSQLWLGDGAGGFAVTESVGWLPDAASTGVAVGDYDNDGAADVYISGVGPSALLNGALGFSNLAEVAGVGDPNDGTVGAWGDYDGDGDLDLYSGAWDAEFLTNSSRLYENLGDGTFGEVTGFLDAALAGRPVLAASFLDYDNDGDADLYVVVDKDHGNILWRNDGPGCGGWCFQDVAPQAGADLHISGMGLAISDYDNDGDLDIYATDILAGWLLQNQTAQGEPVFVDVTMDAGVNLNWVGWGAAFFDYDNDGWPDLYVGQGGYGPAQRNVLFHNRGDGTFQAMGTSSGANDPGFTQPVAYADFDEDGFVDLATGNREDGYQLFRNRGLHGSDYGWVQLELRGSGPVAADAAGARVLLKGEPGPAQLQEIKLGSSQSSSNMRALHFGVGEAATVHLTVLWPDGTSFGLQLEADQLNQRLVVTYPNAVEAQ